jgi:hypothetical protein
MLASDCADMKNYCGQPGGAITAALFLKVGGGQGVSGGKCVERCCQFFPTMELAEPWRLLSFEFGGPLLAGPQAAASLTGDTRWAQLAAITGFRAPDGCAGRWGVAPMLCGVGLVMPVHMHLQGPPAPRSMAP